MEEKQTVIKAQEGPQSQLISCRADVVFYGGAAGGGKSFGLLLDAARNIHHKNYAAVFFRKTKEDIRKPGAIWDVSQEIYMEADGIPREHTLDWYFPSGAQMKFDGLENEGAKHNYQGAQIPWIGFDELTHFSWKTFSYLLSRNRSAHGIPCSVRATCNPDSKSWVRKFIDWYVDKKTGLVIDERSGVIRYFYVVNDVVEWETDKEILMERFPEMSKEGPPLSFTFIKSMLTDNKILTTKDPTYRSKLLGLSLVDRKRLLEGNWNIEEAAGLILNRNWFEVVKAAPSHPHKKTIRYWDRASTEFTGTNDPDWTRGIKMSLYDGLYFIEHLASGRHSPYGVQKLLKNVASQDGQKVDIGLEQDPGQAGEADVQTLIKLLAGYYAKDYPAKVDKITRAKLLSAQAEQGNVKIVCASSEDEKWVEEVLSEFHAFEVKCDKDDIVDAASGAFNALTVLGVGEFTEEMAEASIPFVQNDRRPKW